MLEHRENDHSMHFGSMLLGIAAGVAGTILYATYKEREFNKVVGKTRELGDRSSQYLSEVGDTVRTKAVAMVDSAQTKVDELSENVKKVVERRSHDATPSQL